MEDDAITEEERQEERQFAAYVEGFVGAIGDNPDLIRMWTEW